MVVTTLCKEAAPLTRYRTHDLTRMIANPCSCGSVLPMHDRILGRSDDMIIFKAVNIYPGQIDEVLSTVPGIGSEYQVQLDRGDNGRDVMTLRVEREPNAQDSAGADLAQRIVQAVKSHIMVTCSVDVVDYGSLPRSERKSKRIYDHRASE